MASQTAMCFKILVIYVLLNFLKKTKNYKGGYELDLLYLAIQLIIRKQLPSS